MNAAIIRGLPEKTGRDLDAWLEILKTADLPNRRERVAWLKTEHGLGHVTATTLADYLTGSAHIQLDGDALVDALFAGVSAELRAQADALLAYAQSLDGVEVSPCKGYIGIRAKRQFAAIRPKAGRLEIGLALPESAELHPARGLGGGGIERAVWGDEDWKAPFDRAYAAAR